MSLQQSEIWRSIFIKCSWINKKSIKQTTFGRGFLTEDSFNGLKHFTEKVTAVASLTHVRVVVDHTLPPHCKDQQSYRYHTDILISVFIPWRFHLLSKTSWASIVLCKFFLTHPFNEMFIINGKSHCCNDTFTDNRFTSLLAKNILEEYKLFYAFRISIPLSILSEI